jgi:hypothetical protein
MGVTLSAQIWHSAGGGAVPDCFWLESFYFCELGSPSKLLELYNNPFWDLSYGVENKERKKINTKNGGLPKLPRWSHALRLDQFLHNP